MDWMVSGCGVGVGDAVSEGVRVNVGEVEGVLVGRGVTLAEAVGDAAF
ncbi:MAG: hypothetical protein JSV37_06315 [Anaerolineaceae bacterium]|nr:MAG: hypothetical protein JSV37_06315 [Anaerolineaceae bacterium]